MNITQQIDNLIYLTHDNQDGIPVDFFVTLFTLAKENNLLDTIKKDQVLKIETLYSEQNTKNTIISFFPSYYKTNKQELLETMSKLPYEAKFKMINDIIEFKDKLNVHDINHLFNEIVLKSGASSEYLYKERKPIEQTRLPILTEHFVDKEIFFNSEFKHKREIYDNVDSFLILSNKLAQKNNEDIENEDIQKIIERLSYLNLYYDIQISKGKEIFHNLDKSFPNKNIKEIYFSIAINELYRSLDQASQSRVNLFISTLPTSYKEKKLKGIPYQFYLTLLTNRFINKVSEKNLDNLLSLTTDANVTIAPYLLFSKAELNIEGKINYIYQKNSNCSLLNDINEFIYNPDYTSLINNLNKPVYLVTNAKIESHFIRQNLTDLESLDILNNIKQKEPHIATSIFMALDSDIEFIPYNDITNYVCDYITQGNYLNPTNKKELFDKYSKYIDLTILDARIDKETNSQKAQRKQTLEDFKIFKISHDKLLLEDILSTETKQNNNKKRL